jgi:lipoyl(octanoyl) transferase
MGPQLPIIVKSLGVTQFKEVCDAMQQFTAMRTPETLDEIWITEHLSVYSLGLNRKHIRLPASSQIPVIHCDRGGKITYHGLGQIIIYVLLDLKRRQLNIRQLVSQLENAVIDLLKHYGIDAVARKEAPGVYVNGEKIASLGLRVKNDYCYHGLSVNVNMDLSPFTLIDPCGYAGLKVTQLVDLGVDEDMITISNQLIACFKARLSGYDAW